LYFEKGVFEKLHISQRLDSKTRPICTETGFEMMKVTPVVLRTDVDSKRASHMLYEIPILTKDLGLLCMITERIQRVLFELQRRSSTICSQLLRLETFGVCETENGISLMMITPRATPISSYIGLNGNPCIDEVMFFTSDIGKAISKMNEFGMTGIICYDDVYVRKDASSHVPTLCVSPAVFVLPLLAQQFLPFGSQILAPEFYNCSTYDSRILTWSVGVFLYRLVMGVMPFTNYMMNQIVNLNVLPNDLYKEAIGRMLSAFSRPLPEELSEIELFKVSNGWKMFSSGDTSRYVKCIDINASPDGSCVYAGQNEVGNNVVIWEQSMTTAVEIVKEARVIRLCESNHIANVIDVCINNGRTYLVTEGCNIGSLEKYLEFKKANGGITRTEVEHLSREIINAIRYLRIEKGVVVTDLRLGDFMLSTSPESRFPIVKLARCRGCSSVRECEYNGKGRKDLQSLGEVLKEVCLCCNEQVSPASVNIFGGFQVQQEEVMRTNVGIMQIQKIIQDLMKPDGMDWGTFMNIPYIGAITAEDYRMEQEKMRMKQQEMYFCNGFDGNAYDQSYDMKMNFNPVSSNFIMM